jgi:hypothetical protein
LFHSADSVGRFGDIRRRSGRWIFKREVAGCGSGGRRNCKLAARENRALVNVGFARCGRWARVRLNGEWPFGYARTRGGKKKTPAGWASAGACGGNFPLLAFVCDERRMRCNLSLIGAAVRRSKNWHPHVLCRMLRIGDKEKERLMYGRHTIRLFTSLGVAERLTLA